MYDFYDKGGLVKKFQIAGPAANGMKVTVIANFDVYPQARTVTFQNTGDWFNYVANGAGTGINGSTSATFTFASATQNITLQPGEYQVYIYQPANGYTFMCSGNWTDVANWMYGSIPSAVLPSGAEINLLRYHVVNAF